jgi:copper chaperone CopZ
VTTETFKVTGMTCGHCVAAVTTELQGLDGVSEVSVDLIAGGVSEVTVTSEVPVGAELIAVALDEAGTYQLA